MSVAVFVFIATVHIITAANKTRNSTPLLEALTEI